MNILQIYVSWMNSLHHLTVISTVDDEAYEELFCKWNDGKKEKKERKEKKKERRKERKKERKKER